MKLYVCSGTFQTPDRADIAAGAINYASTI